MAVYLQSAHVAGFPIGYGSGKSRNVGTTPSSAKRLDVLWHFSIYRFFNNRCDNGSGMSVRLCREVLAVIEQDITVKRRLIDSFRTRMLNPWGAFYLS